MIKKFSAIIVVIGFFIVWEILAKAGVLDLQFVPAFSTVMKETWKMTKTGELPIHVLTSLTRLVVGILSAIITALPLGFLLAYQCPRLAKFLTPLFVNLSFVNAFTLIPVFMLILGMGELSKVFIIYWVVLWPALFSTIAGVLNIDPVVIKAARVMGARGVKLFFSVIIPGCVRRLFMGIKSSISMGFTVLIGAEMLGSKHGLGFIVFVAQKNYNIPREYVGILFIAILGVIVSVSLDTIQKRVVVWKEG
ncbi:ABC transporter permease [Clostridia bacterium]|nr:ABC transporter permease [Clostridia bacterium]